MQARPHIANITRKFLIERQRNVPENLQEQFRALVQEWENIRLKTPYLHSIINKKFIVLNVYVPDYTFVLH